MKKSLLALALCGLPIAGFAQHTFDALQLSQTELRGTSRFMSMGGAFGALGGDISTLNQNPAGIGVYRSSDLGVTLSLDLNSTETPGAPKQDDTKFNCNNFGYVGALKLESEVMPNFNFGFTYNRVNSFNRHYRGMAYNIPTSITNYLADQANADGMTTAILDPANKDPFYMNGGGAWNQILAYQNYLINPSTPQGTGFNGLGYDGVVGNAEFDILEHGHTDEFSIGLGGNIANTMYWGMALGITDMVYEYDKYYGETLDNTVVYDRANNSGAKLVDGNANIGFEDFSRTTGNGYNFKFGVIVKPINALRLGLAFHTPTFYKMKDTYTSYVDAEYFGENVLDNQITRTDEHGSYLEGSYTTSGRTPTNSVWYRISTPWRFIGSAAVVMGSKAILSADYEYIDNKSMRIKDEYGTEWPDATALMKNTLKATHVMRVGGEYRINPNWSLRAGYSYQTTPAQDWVKNNTDYADVGGCNPSYTFDNSVQHITAGFGYAYKNVYFNMAYVHKNRKSTYNAFPLDDKGKNVSWDVKEKDNKISATLGFRF